MAKSHQLELEDMLRLIAEMPSVPIPQLNVSGGDPFLYRDQVTALVRAGRAAGLKSITINTNGFWAKSEEQCREVLAELRAAGFMQSGDDRLKMSAGIFHQEFLPVESVFTLAKAHYQCFGTAFDLDYEAAPNDSSACEMREEIATRGLANQIRLTVRDVTPLGRGAALGLVSPESLRRRQPIRVPCSGINQIVIDPDYRSRPCCGFNSDNLGVVTGSVRSTGLRDIVKSMQNDPLLQFLANRPLSDIFAEVGKEANPAGYPGRCSLCQEAVGDLSDKEAVQARLFGRQNFYPFWFDDAE
jgi:hypothetical protein